MRGGKRQGLGERKAVAIRLPLLAKSLLLAVMRDEAQPTAPYCHPRFAAVEKSGPGEGGAVVHEHRIRFV